MTDEISNWVQTHRTEILECVRSLVRIETENHAPEGHEQKGQMAVASLLNLLGCEVDAYAITSASIPRHDPDRSIDHSRYCYHKHRRRSHDNRAVRASGDY